MERKDSYTGFEISRYLAIKGESGSVRLITGFRTSGYLVGLTRYLKAIW